MSSAPAVTQPGAYRRRSVWYTLRAGAEQRKLVLPRKPSSATWRAWLSSLSDFASVRSAVTSAWRAVRSAPIWWISVSYSLLSSALNCPVARLGHGRGQNVEQRRPQGAGTDHQLIGEPLNVRLQLTDQIGIRLLHRDFLRRQLLGHPGQLQHPHPAASRSLTPRPGRRTPGGCGPAGPCRCS